MNRQTTRFRACTKRTCKWLSLLVLTGLVGIASSGLQAEEAASSRWSAANPPTPASLGPIPDVAPPNRMGAGEPTAGDAIGNGLRRLPPVEDTSLAEEPNETAAAQAEIASPPSAQPSAEPARPAPPVDWSRPHVVIGPEVAERQVSHEETVLTPAAAQGQLSRFSQMADGMLTAAAAPSPAATVSRYEETSAREVQPVSVARQPVFARVFDETSPAVETMSATVSETAPESVAKAADTPEPSGTPETPETRGVLSPIFACRLLGLPALSEAPRAARSDETTTIR